jgi:hypothetical protein
MSAIFNGIAYSAKTIQTNPVYLELKTLQDYIKTPVLTIAKLTVNGTDESSTIVANNSISTLGGIGVTGKSVFNDTITSSVTTGTAPLVVASTTNVANLNASLLNGATFESPGAIGSTTASTGAFTTLSASGLITANDGLTSTAGTTTLGTTNIANGETLNVGTSGNTSNLNVFGNLNLGPTTDPNLEYFIRSAGQIRINANDAVIQNGSFIGLILNAGVSSNTSYINIFGSSASGSRNITFGTSNTDRMSISSTGLVTISGAVAIDTSQTGTFQNRTITSNPNFGMIFCANRPTGNIGSFLFCNSTAATQYVAINHSSAMLDVSGTGRFSGLITANAGINFGNASSTTNLNSGVSIFVGSGNAYGMDLGYNSNSARYRTRLYCPSSADISFSTAAVNASTQSNFTDRVIINGSSGNVSITSTTDTTSTTTGSIVTSGGMAIAKNLLIGESILNNSGRGILYQSGSVVNYAGSSNANASFNTSGTDTVDLATISYAAKNTTNSLLITANIVCVRNGGSSNQYITADIRVNTTNIQVINNALCNAKGSFERDAGSSQILYTPGDTDLHNYSIRINLAFTGGTQFIMFVYTLTILELAN